MSEIKKDYLYTKDHEWVRKGGNPKVVVVGITDFAQSALGDVTYLQLPTPGKSYKKGEILGTVESVKAVSDIYAPISGTVTKVNEGLNSDPGVLNTDPFGAGWLVEFEAAHESEFTDLLSPDAYAGIAH